jgi:hypothetical protein
MLPTPLPPARRWPAARDVDGAAPLVTLAAEGRLAATWAGNLDAARA